MAVPNFEHQYDELSEEASDPRYMRLCAMQAKALSWVTAKHAQERISLLLAIKREQREDQDYVWPDPNSDGWIDAWNGWYETEAEARRDGANGIGRPWVLAYGEGLITEDERERRAEHETVGESLRADQGT